MLLLRQKIEGWENFINEQVSGVFPYMYSDSVLSGWEDITSIENNNLYGYHAADYKRATDEVNILFQAKEGSTQEEKWNNCTQTEKEAVAQRQLVESALRLQVYTQEQDQQNFIIFSDSSNSSRSDRVDYCKISMGYQMAAEDGQDLFTSVSEKIPRYISTNDPDLNNWMLSLPPYSAGGFKAKPYYTQQLEGIYIQIVINGIY